MRHVGHCWRSKDELISSPKYFYTWMCKCVGWPARTYLQQHCMNTGCSLEDFLGVMNDRDRWKERIREIYASVWLHENDDDIYIYIYRYAFLPLLGELSSEWSNCVAISVYARLFIWIELPVAVKWIYVNNNICDS